jgi:hypothetical protein
MKNYTYILYFLIIIFLILFTNSINYVEGDDASTILYHLIGRDVNLQEPYAKYNSGLDFLLSYVDNNQEIALRNLSFYLSFFFAVGILILFFILFETIFKIKNEKLNYSFFFFLPFIIPELLFNSLVINSSNISYFFAVLSLIFYIKSINDIKVNSIYLFISILSFAISLPFRWSIIMFLPVFISFHIYIYNDNLLKILKINFVHIFSSLIIGFSLIYLTGYSLNDFIEIMLWGNKYSKDKESSFQELFATGSAFLTPIVILLLLIGFVYFLKNSKLSYKSIFFIIIPTLPFLFLGFFPSYKFLFPIFPLLLFIIYIGYSNLYNKYKKITLILLFIGIISTWFIGFQIQDNKYAYGKSFEFKKSYILPIDYNSKNNSKKINISFNGGTFMPTLEGGRPIYGYFYVFAYQWKELINRQQKTLDTIVDILNKNNTIQILQDRRTAFLQCTLYKYGYITKMPFKDFNKDLLYRDFYKNNKQIRLYAIKDSSNRIKVTNDFISSNVVIFRSSYSSLIREIYTENKEKNKILFWDIYTISNFKIQ